MLRMKTQISTAVLMSFGLLGVEALASGTRGTEAQQPKPMQPAQRQSEKADRTEDRTKKDSNRLRGVWIVATFEYKGTRRPAGPYAYAFDGDRYTFTTKDGKEPYRGTVKIDATKEPKQIDLTITEGEGKGDRRLGLYELEGDTLRMAFNPGGKERPKELTTSPDTDTKLWVYKRKKTK